MYNVGGNIQKILTYPYSTGNLDSASATSTVSLNYSNDILTECNSNVILYDAMDRPIKYKGYNYGWYRNKLSSIYKGNSSQSGALYEFCGFDYNAYGQRVAKNYIYDSNPGSTSDYSYNYRTSYEYDNSGRLVREVIREIMTYSGGGTRTHELVYLYDESGIIGCVHTLNGGTPKSYYFERNLQGDVVGIFDESGSKIVTYAYDAYGNCTITSGIGKEISRLNPIRYRGYYLDRETGLYYLNARYYSPEWRRFISPDDTAYIDPESVNGLNLYCYCNNDPVNFVDPSGHLAISSFLIGLGIAGLIGAGVGATSYVAGQAIDYAFTGTWEWSWGGFVGSITGGALGGMAAYSFNLLKLSIIGIFVSGFSTTAVTMVGENITNDAHYTAKDIFNESLVDGLTSIISVGIMKNIKFEPINSGRGSYLAISKQIYTKIQNGTITRVSARTLGKMFISEFYDGLFDLFVDSVSF